MFFYVIGAWPVVGFMGLDVALIWWAFRANFADARRAEHIEITSDELVLRRLAEDRPAQEQRFARRWVRVELEEDRERELVGPLISAFWRKTHGNRQFPGGPGAAFLCQRPESGADKSAVLSKKRVVPGLGRH